MLCSLALSAVTLWGVSVTAPAKNARDALRSLKDETLGVMLLRYERGDGGEDFLSLRTSLALHATPLLREGEENIAQAWSAELAPKTVRNYNAFVSGVMAAVYGYVPYSVILPPKEPVNYYIPSDDEVNQTLQAAKGTELYLPILLAAFGPMRRGEICALPCKNIDFSTGVVHVQYSYSYTEDNTWVIKRTKTYDSDRYISFPGFVIDAIRLRGKDNVTRFLPNQLTQNFEDLLLRAGIPHYRFHDLRHYCASTLHAIGMPDAYIMQRGGWKTDTVLKQVYRHVLAKQQGQINEKANNYFSSIVSHEISHNLSIVS